MHRLKRICAKIKRDIRNRTRKPLNTPDAEASLKRQESLIDRKLNLNAKEARICTQKAEEIDKHPTRLLDRFHLLLENSASGIPCQNKERAHRALACMQVLI